MVERRKRSLNLSLSYPLTPLVAHAIWKTKQKNCAKKCEMEVNTETANWEALGSAWAARDALPCWLGSMPWGGIAGNLCSSGVQFCSSDVLRATVYSRIGLSNFLYQNLLLCKVSCVDIHPGKIVVCRDHAAMLGWQGSGFSVYSS